MNDFPKFQRKMGNTQKSSGPVQSEDQVDSAKSDDNVRLIGFFNKITGGSGELSEEVFKTLFSPCTDYGTLLFEYLKKTASTSDQAAPLTWTEFASQGSHILELLSLSQKLEFYFNVFSRGATTLDKDGALKMLQTSYNLSWQYTGLGEIPESDGCILQSCVESLFGREEVVSSTKLCSWSLGPLLENIHLYTASVLCGDVTSGKAEASSRPELIDKICDNSTILNSTVLWFMSSTLPVLYLPSSAHGGKSADAGSPPEDVTKHSNLLCAAEQWHCLYSSEDQGLSLNRFEHHVFAYKGPTLLLVNFESHLYVVAVDEEWRESGSRWGKHNSQLYQLKPHCRVMEGGPGLIFMNIRDRTLPKCLGFEKNGKMTIDGEFAKVKHYGVDYKLHSIEVWGCGGQDMLAQQQEQKKWEKREAEKQKNRKLKVDDWRDNPDRLLLQMGGVETDHEHTDRGSV